VSLRLLHVSQPVEAGVPRVVSALLADQIARGHDVHLACPPGPGLAVSARTLGATTHSWRAGRAPGPGVRDETRRLARVIDRVDPDVVVLHSAKAGLAGRLAVRGRRPTVFVPHAWSFDAVSGPLAGLSTTWEVLAARWTDVVVCVSDDEQAAGRAAGIAARTVVVPNGVDVDVLTPRPAAPARERLGLPDRPTVVCVGRLAEQKGQDLLLAAWGDVLLALPGAQLVLVGDGPQRAALQGLAGPGVRFAGAREDPTDFYAAADAVVVPSRWEGGPLVPLEAMAMGRPVVAFDVQGVRASLGHTGEVVAPGDVRGLAAALVGLLTAPQDAAARGRAARERALEVADLRDTMQSWDDVVASVAPGRAREEKRPLRVTPVQRLAPLLLARALETVDVAAIAGTAPGDRARARGLSALGVPVWWQGIPAAAPRALGAPVVSGAADGEQLSRAARRPGADTTGGPRISVVVTVLDEGAALGRLVDDLLPQLADGDELVLVDGGSTDGSLESLPAHPALRTEVVPGAGISAGRNHGIGVAANEVIVCTDAGCTPDPGFVEGFRRAFAVADPPALVSGVYTAAARTAMEMAQALACYPQPREVRRPSLFVRSYTRLFGSGFDPRFAVGRCVAFTREAWRAAGGFPEHLPTGEDVSFGLAVARYGRCEATTDAVVDWVQRDGLAATWRMYRSYGRASTAGGNRALLVRDGVRGLAYVVAPLLAARPGGRRAVALGAAAYLSLPVARAVRAGAGPRAIGLLPVALAVKDLGKLAGAVQGLMRSTR
jgi:glycosyltransferase involved in cell wall biosynthesis